MSPEDSGPSCEEAPRMQQMLFASRQTGDDQQGALQSDHRVLLDLFQRYLQETALEKRSSDQFHLQTTGRC